MELQIVLGLRLVALALVTLSRFFGIGAVLDEKLGAELIVATPCARIYVVPQGKFRNIALK
jgi:hypothetical protein